MFASIYSDYVVMMLGVFFRVELVRGKLNQFSLDKRKTYV